jgi:hypothetical protein
MLREMAIAVEWDVEQMPELADCEGYVDMSYTVEDAKKMADKIERSMAA